MSVLFICLDISLFKSVFLVLSYFCIFDLCVRYVGFVLGVLLLRYFYIYLCR